ncbi:MAG: reactive intermediate/imine deaminase [Planctomycetales bacterium 4572_13]|nr:MAG: reactive intermediate/imine deaminase [Planctomycetales bacterium 4572_13]
MTKRKAVQTDIAPAAMGPYSQALLMGNTLYISGQLGIDPATGKMVDGPTAAQAEQALKNIMAILMEANMSMHNVVQAQVFLADIGDFSAVNEVYKTFFAEPYPARAAIQAGALPAGGSVEILVTAVNV